MTAALSASDVHFSYGARPALAGVSLAVRPGEIVALVGPNGAGKTTLLKLLAGLLVPGHGVVQVLAPRHRTVAYLAQSEELPSDWSVREVVELGRLPYVGFWRVAAPSDAVAVQRAMERTAILERAGCRIGSLSGGERQRVALARALAQEPRVLLLDEPTTHLDLRHQTELFATLRMEAARGVAVVSVMHDLALAALADRCVMLSEGRVRADARAADVLRSDLLSEVYRTDVEVLRTNDGRLAIMATQPSVAEAPHTSREEKKAWKHIASS